MGLTAGVVGVGGAVVEALGMFSSFFFFSSPFQLTLVDVSRLLQI